MALAPTPTADATMPAADDTAPVDDTGGGDTVLVTICKSADGTYTVYAGDEPEEGTDEGTGEQTNGDDAGAAVGQSAAEGAPETYDSPPGGGPAESAQPQHAQSVGEALKMAMTILHDDESGSEGGAEGAFQSGYGDTGGQAPPLAQKY